jgi:uncharacterized protein
MHAVHTPLTPEINAETAAYWEACNERRLLLRRCRATGKPYHPPRTMSPFSGTTDTEWIESSGQGVIYSFSVMTRKGTPHCIAYVTLQEGPTMLSALVDCDPNMLSIGQPVRTVFVASADGQFVPMFTPVS